MIKYNELLKKINFTRYRDIFRRFTIEKDNYCFSILTGSHCNSAELGTIEMAILKDGEFVDFEDTTEITTDNAIIHYMSFEDFEKFINELEKTKTEDLEKLFLKYKEEQEDE